MALCCIYFGPWLSAKLPIKEFPVYKVLTNIANTQRCSFAAFMCLGEKGFAFTLITEKDKEFAGALVRNLEDANQHVPKPLLDLALQVRFLLKFRIFLYRTELG